VPLKRKIKDSSM